MKLLPRGVFASRDPCHNGRVADASADDFREFTREMNLRFAKAFEAGVRSIDANTRVMEQMEARLRAMNRDANARRGEHRELIEEMRAQRQALFRVLDRLDGNGGTAPAT